MLVFLMHSVKIDLLNPEVKPTRYQKCIYSDPNRRLPLKGEEKAQALHELYQCFHSQVVKLASSGYFARILDNVDSLYQGAEEPTILAFTNPILFNPPRIALIIQRFIMRDVLEDTLDNYSFEGLPAPREGSVWKWVVEEAKGKGILDQLIERQVEASSPWKEAAFGARTGLHFDEEEWGGNVR